MLACFAAEEIASRRIGHSDIVAIFLITTNKRELHWRIAW